MPTPHEKLGNQLEANGPEILNKWRRAVRALVEVSHLPQQLLDDQITAVLHSVIKGLRMRGDDGARKATEQLRDGASAGHGVERLRVGFCIDEVVAEYNVLRYLVFETAHEANIELNQSLVHIVNAVIDAAIGVAVSTYARQNVIDERRRRAEHLAFVCHEMRTPLSTMAALTAQLRLAQDQTDTADAAGAFDRSVGKLDELIYQLIEESRCISQDLEARLERKYVALNPLVESIVLSLLTQAEEVGIELKCTVSADLKLAVDPNFLDVIISNLVKNAIDHAGATKVAIGATRNSRATELCLWVQDNGQGIPEGQMKRIFEPYQTNRAEDGGTGLGLHIAQRFVEAHGAAIDVKNLETRGARFEITFPMGHESMLC